MFFAALVTKSHQKVTNDQLLSEYYAGEDHGALSELSRAPRKQATTATHVLNDTTHSPRLFRYEQDLTTMAEREGRKRK